MTQDNTTDLFNLIIKDSANVIKMMKKFKISTSNTRYGFILNLMSEIINELTFLVSPVIKSNNAIFDFMLEHQSMTNEFTLMDDSKIQILCSNHIENLIYKYIQISIEEELYETAFNFKKFVDYRDDYIKRKLKRK